MTLLKAFFDESYNQKTYCVAGYGFQKLRLKKFDSEWASMLRRYKLPFFRMSACAHGNAPFQHLSKDERSAVAQQAIELIKKYAGKGICVTIDREMFRDHHTKNPVVNSPYELCVWMCLVGIRDWANTIDVDGSVGHYFEAGDSAEAAASRLMRMAFKVPQLAQFYKLSEFGFVQKVDSRPCQAADLLAWHWLKYWTDKQEGKGPRKDFQSLMSMPRAWIDISESDIVRLTKLWEEGNAFATSAAELERLLDQQLADGTI